MRRFSLFSAVLICLCAYIIKYPADNREDEPDMMTTETTIWTVWLNQARKIASFHAIDGYIRYDFRDHGHFLHYMQELQDGGYLFQ